MDMNMGMPDQNGHGPGCIYPSVLMGPMPQPCNPSRNRATQVSTECAVAGSCAVVEDGAGEEEGEQRRGRENARLPHPAT